MHVAFDQMSEKCGGRPPLRTQPTGQQAQARPVDGVAGRRGSVGDSRGRSGPPVAFVYRAVTTATTDSYVTAEIAFPAD